MRCSAGSVLLAALVLALPGRAFEELGPVEKARREYPTIFLPEHVQIVQINGKSHWVFAGQAERLVDSESESELWQEAALSARAVFFAYMAKDKPGHEVVLERCSQLYRLKENKLYTVVLCVPQSLVRIVKKENKSAAVCGTDTDMELPMPLVPSSIPNKVSDLNKGIVSEKAKTIENPVKTSDGKTETACISTNVAGTAKVEEGAERAKRSLNERIEVLRTRRENDPGNWKVDRRLGLLLAQSGRSGEAVGLLNAAARKSFADLEADVADRVCCLMDAARVNEKVGRLGAALKYFRMVLHMECSEEVRHEANDGVNRILMRNTDLLL